tara:strand:- start:17859 stop:18371 length:513 start_codon:yes stop_codon:yes gene_type:complete
MNTLKINDIVTPFSTNDDYNEDERAVIQSAIGILANKLVNQDEAYHLTTTQASKDFLQLKIGTSSREIFAVLLLNNEHRVIAYEELSVGTVGAATVYPREVAKLALTHNASAMIIAHNHPSGTLESSNADDAITQRIGIACEMLDIRLLDHVIVSLRGTMSYNEQGKMPI